jgi:NAD(P)-dependent dehydrogenase (short-subunit alcohol dehydrogenase family)
LEDATMTTELTNEQQETTLPLRGRTAVVTGGSRGLGAAAARRLAHAGARVAVIGRDPRTLQAARAALPNDTVVLAVDLAEPDAPSAVLEWALTELGAIDVLVNNAGIIHYAASDSLDSAELDAVLALNVRAPLLLAGATAAHMARAGRGSIINISSALSNLGTPQNSVFAASKGAIDAATRALAAEWGPSGVRVNAIRPAVTRTDMAMPIISNEPIVATYLRGVPLGRVGEAEDIGEAVLFLASDAAAYITGQVINVDGGWGTTARSIAEGG